jgi:solute carrier family 25 aspartate/glutamate transporter 12/13
MKLYVGKRGGRHVLGCTYTCIAHRQKAYKLTPDSEFTQLIKGYQGERLRQAFHFFDQDGDGYINPDEFQKIIVVRVYANE